MNCPQRSLPTYPAQSRRFRETGTVVVKAELDETGRVVSATVHSSSGHPQLDEAALASVRTWLCTPALRDGTPVPATALQPFQFVLRGN